MLKAFDSPKAAQYPCFRYSENLRKYQLWLHVQYIRLTEELSMEKLVKPQLGQETPYSWQQLMFKGLFGSSGEMPEEYFLF